MTDDPRDILREAGVEVPETDGVTMDLYMTDLARLHGKDVPEWAWDSYTDSAECIVLALAHIVAKYKWQRDTAVANHCENGMRSAEGVDKCEFCSAVIADLDRGWEGKDETN